MNGAGVLAVAANQDQNGSRFLLMRPVIMRGAMGWRAVIESHHMAEQWISTLMTFDKQSNGRRTVVESKSSRSFNHGIWLRFHLLKLTQKVKFLLQSETT